MTTSTLKIYVYNTTLFSELMTFMKKRRFDNNKNMFIIKNPACGSNDRTVYAPIVHRGFGESIHDAGPFFEIGNSLITYR